MLPFQTLTETIHQGAYLISEAEWYRSVDKIDISNAAALLSGTVLGRSGNPAGETATAAAGSDNTGNGVLTLASPATSPQAVDGPYSVVMTSATAFNVMGPNGRIIDKGTMAGGFVGPVSFSLAAGTTPFVSGDRFTITVLRPDGIGDAWAALAADGSVEAAGILFTQVRAASVPGLQTVTAHTRDCEVRSSSLTWPTGFTVPQIQEATLQLERRGIIIRPL